MWAVGDSGTVASRTGGSWTATKLDWNPLQGIRGSSPSDLWAVDYTGAILHWDRSTCTATRVALTAAWPKS